MKTAIKKGAKPTKKVMKQYFLCKVKYQREDETGRLANVTESYLLDAVSFQDAETRIYEQMTERVRGEFIVKSIAKSPLTDVFDYEDSDLWHECKVTYYIAEESGKEKKITNLMLVNAANVKEAYDRIYQSLNNMLVSFKVPQIKESAILEIFEYQKVEQEEPEEVLA